MLAEQGLWAASLMLITQDAIWPLRIPNPRNTWEFVGSFEEQAEAFRSGSKQLPIMTAKRAMRKDRALWFLETDQLDKTAEMMGYDSLFVNRTCDFVQEAVTLVKKLYQGKETKCPMTPTML